MNRRSLKLRWLKTKGALNGTIQKILDINRKRKHLSTLPNDRRQEQDLDLELKMLNALADQQAKLMRRYEQKITAEEQTAILP